MWKEKPIPSSASSMRTEVQRASRHGAVGVLQFVDVANDHGQSYSAAICWSVRREAGVDGAPRGCRGLRLNCSIGRGQRGENLDDLVVGARGLDDQAVPEGIRRRSSSASSPEPTSTPRIMPRPLSVGARHDLGGDPLQAARRARRPSRAISFWKLSSDQNFSIATRAVTKAWVLPRKVPLCSAGFQMSCSRLDQQRRERQAEARERLRQRDDVRLDAHLLEREEGAGAADAGLDVVDDQQRAVLLGEPGDALAPIPSRRRSARPRPAPARR